MPETRLILQLSLSFPHLSTLYQELYLGDNSSRTGIQASATLRSIWSNAAPIYQGQKGSSRWVVGQITGRGTKPTLVSMHTKARGLEGKEPCCALYLTRLFTDQ